LFFTALHPEKLRTKKPRSVPLCLRILSSLFFLLDIKISKTISDLRWLKRTTREDAEKKESEKRERPNSSFEIIGKISK